MELWLYLDSMFSLLDLSLKAVITNFLFEQLFVLPKGGISKGNIAFG